MINDNIDTNANKNPLDELKPIECANKVVAHNLIHSPSDWSVNRKGNRCRLVFIILQQKNKNEYNLSLTLDQEVDIRSILIGFNSVWTDYSDKVLGVP